jgi:hypothetical protein
MNRLRTFNQLSQLNYSFFTTHINLIAHLFSALISGDYPFCISKVEYIWILMFILVSTDKLCQYRFVAPQANIFHIITNHFFISERNSRHLQYLLVKSVEKAKVLIWIYYLQGFWRDSNHTTSANILICSYIRSFFQYKSFSSKLFFWF